MGEAVDGRQLRISSPWALAGSVAGSLVVFATTFRVYFLGDDFDGIRSVRDEPASLAWFTQAGVGGHLRPLSRLSLWATYRLSGTEPWGYHLWNVVLFGGTAWLVGLLAAELLRGRGSASVRRRAPWIALVAFVVLPSHAEPVSWIAAQADLVLAPLVVVMVLAWSRWRRLGGGWAWWSCAAFALALLAKEPAVVLPLVLVAHELWLPRPGETRWGSLRSSGRALAPFAAVLVGYVVLYTAGTGVFVGQEGVGIDDGPLQAVRHAVQVVVRTLVPPLPIGWWVALAVAALIGAGALALAVVRSRRRPRRSAGRRLAVPSDLGGLVGFLATALLVVVAPIAHLGTSPLTPAGERLAYLPSVFAVLLLALGLAVLLERAPRAGRAVAVVGTLLAVVLLARSTQVYVRAGQVSERVARSAATFPVDQPVTILTMPDSLDGAWIGRDRTPSDVALLDGWRHPARFQEVSEFTMDGPADTVTASRGSCPTCVVLHLDAPGARFAFPMPSEIPVPHASAGVTAIAVDGRTIEFELDPTFDPARFWYYSGGRYVPLDVGSS